MIRNGQDVPQEPDRDHDMTETQVDASEGGEPVPVAMRDEASVAEEDKSQGPSHLVEDSPTVPGATSTKSEPLAQMPHALIGGGQDDALKNLMMSWYYAGYYTGLREGQQQAHVGSTTASHR
ncbi:MAG: hypothetical protein M4579_005267 [Chaenotheca gracillima]|nr:MAG: hypothetical protein M4579_005267 [Chaenotheca gracillima]